MSPTRRRARFAELWAPYWPGKSLAAFFEATAAARPGALAIADGSLRLSFAQLQEAAARVAGGLGRLGIRPGDTVAYQLPNWWEAIAFFLGAARAGAVVNPLLPLFREPELLFTLQQSQASLVLVAEEHRGIGHRAIVEGLRDRLPSLRHVVACRGAPGSGSFEEMLGSGSSAAAAELPGDAVLLLMYTSGTTAEPKGVLHTHDTLAAEVLSLARVHGLGPGDVTLLPSPLTHISGVLHGILVPAILGTAAVLMERWDVRRALELVEAEEVTYMVGAPTFLRDLIAGAGGEGRELGSLRLFSCGGADVSGELIRRARARLPGCVAKRVYGSTEFPTISTTGADDAEQRGADSEGRPIAPVEVRIVDESGGSLAGGGVGEVQARGPECFVGYADAALDDEAFTADGWFRSGDLGSLDADGYLTIAGRMKEIVVRKGEKISVRQLEELIAAHPAVAEVSVVALPDADTGERACAAVRLKPEARLDLESLCRFLGERGLARQKHPEQLELLEALPRTESGKVQRPALHRLLEARPFARRSR